jgi:predicted ABC-type sugar transport system permease subunit
VGTCGAADYSKYGIILQDLVVRRNCLIQRQIAIKLRASYHSIRNWSLQSIYWILVAIVIVAVATSLILHFTLSGQQPANFAVGAYGQSAFQWNFRLIF